MTRPPFTAAQVLACPMPPNDAGAATIGDYFVELLATMWREGPNFDGKRPFGCSTWRIDLHEALVRGGAAPGVINGDGELESSDDEAVDGLITQAIEALRSLTQPTPDTVEQIRRLAGSGVPDIKIAAAVGLSPRRVRSVRVRKGIPSGRPVDRVRNEVRPGQVWQARATGARVRVDVVDALYAHTMRLGTGIRTRNRVDLLQSRYRLVKETTRA